MLTTASSTADEVHRFGGDMYTTAPCSRAHFEGISTPPPDPARRPADTSYGSFAALPQGSTVPCPVSTTTGGALCFSACILCVWLIGPLSNLAGHVSSPSRVCWGLGEEWVRCRSAQGGVCRFRCR